MVNHEYELVDIIKIGPKGPYSDGIFTIIVTDDYSNKVSLECPNHLIHIINYIYGMEYKSIPMVWNGSKLSINWLKDFPLKDMLLTKEIIEA